MRSVKAKVRAGTIFLFFLVVISGACSIYYLARFKVASEHIIRANYESLEYAHRMQVALDSVVGGNADYTDTLFANLVRQESNITEAGEEAATQALRSQIERLQNGDAGSIASIKAALQQVLVLNMKAIKVKSGNSENALNKALTYLVTIVSIVLLVGVTFVYNFPSIITAPINRLTEAISEISRKNYAHRVHIESKDEFGDLARSFNTMAERLEYFESSNLNKIIFEKGRAEAVINSLKDASIGIDKEDIVLFANNQALGLLGLPGKEIVGRNVVEVSRRNDLLRYLLEERGTIPFKIVVEGKENYFIKEATEVAEEGSTSRIIVLKNITSFKELDVAKTNFIATISHELKTPLASSDFSLKLLEDDRVGRLSAEQGELVQTLKSDNQRMLRILSELLNMTQVEAGKIQLDIEEVQPEQILQTSIDTVAASAREKEITISRVEEVGLPTVRVDREKIVWVLNNLLTNAIKYGPVKSTVRLSIRNESDHLAFAVQDGGPGIDPQFHDRIFERYFRVPGRSDAKGSGIGLAICKELVEAMKGRLWVESTPGQGSTFGFDLPKG